MNTNNFKFKIILIIALSILFIFNSCNTTKVGENDIEDILIIYNLCIEDLENYTSYGYKKNDYSNTNSISMEQGKLIPTYNTSEVALVVDGFFKVYDQENDVFYLTRYGDFAIKDDIIVTIDTGYILMPEMTGPLDSNKIDIYEPENYADLIKIGSYFLPTGNVIKLVTYKLVHPYIISGALEMSNVNLIDTLLKMREILYQFKYNYSESNEINNMQQRIELINLMIPEIIEHEMFITGYERIVDIQFKLEILKMSEQNELEDFDALEEEKLRRRFKNPNDYFFPIGEFITYLEIDLIN